MARKKLSEQKKILREIEELKVKISKLDNYNEEELNRIIRDSRKKISRIKTELSKFYEKSKKVKVNVSKKVSFSLGDFKGKQKGFYKGMCTVYGKNKVDELLKEVVEETGLSKGQALDWICNTMGGTHQAVTDSFYDQDLEELERKEFFKWNPRGTESDFEDYMILAKEENYERFIFKDLLEFLSGRLKTDVAAGLFR